LQPVDDEVRRAGGRTLDEAEHALDERLDHADRARRILDDEHQELVDVLDQFQGCADRSGQR